MPSENLAAEAYALLLEIWRNREPITIRTSLDTFEHMAMTSLTTDGVATFRRIELKKGGR